MLALKLAIRFFFIGMHSMFHSHYSTGFLCACQIRWFVHVKKPQNPIHVDSIVHHNWTNKSCSKIPAVCDDFFYCTLNQQYSNIYGRINNKIYIYMITTASFDIYEVKQRFAL